MKSMRIILSNNWFPPVLTGSSFYTDSLARALVDRGHDILVVTFDWGPEYAPAVDVPFRVCRLPIIRPPNLGPFRKLRMFGISFTPGNRRLLLRLIASFKPHLYHQVNHIFDSLFLSLSAARRARIPIVGSITTLVQHPTPWKHWFLERADRRLLGAWGVRRWDGIVSLDTSAHRYVGEVYGKDVQARSVVIPFGVRKEQMPLYAVPEPKEATPQILMTGHMHAFRNPVQLIRAMPLILDQVPDARLIVAGKLYMDEPVRVARELGLSDEQVTFLGQHPHEEVIGLMKRSHVFASWVTGRYKGLGTAPMEAMLCGTPVVNDLPSDLFGAARLESGENILLVDSTEPRSIADGIVSLLVDKKLQEQVGEGGRRFVREHLSWETIAAQMEAFYERVLTERASP